MHGNANPFRIFHNLLPRSAFQWQKLYLAIFPSDQAAEQKPPRRTGDQNITVQGSSILVRCAAGKPDLIAGAVIAHAALHPQCNHVRFDGGLRKRFGSLKCMRASMIEYCCHRQFILIRQGKQLGAIYAQCPRDPVEPVQRQGARSGFQPPDSLCRGRWIAATGNIIQREAFGLTHFPDAVNHIYLQPIWFILSYILFQMAREKSFQEIAKDPKWTCLQKNRMISKTRASWLNGLCRKIMPKVPASAEKPKPESDRRAVSA